MQMISGDGTQLPSVTGLKNISLLLTDLGEVLGGLFYEDSGVTYPQTLAGWQSLGPDGPGTPACLIPKIFLANGEGLAYTYNTAAVAASGATLNGGLTSPPTLAPNESGVYEISRAAYTFDGHNYNIAVIFNDDLGESHFTTQFYAQAQRVARQQSLDVFYGRGGAPAQSQVVSGALVPLGRIFFLLRTCRSLLSRFQLSADTEALKTRLDVMQRLADAETALNRAVRANGRVAPGGLFRREREVLVVDLLEIIASAINDASGDATYARRVDGLRKSQDQQVRVRGVQQPTARTQAKFLAVAQQLLTDMLAFFVRLGV